MLVAKLMNMILTGSSELSFPRNLFITKGVAKIMGGKYRSVVKVQGDKDSLFPEGLNESIEICLFGICAC